jgi:hypothetical protein
MRLNTQAQNLLRREIDKQAQPLNQDIQRQIVLKRLDKLAQEPGQPLTKPELEQAVVDLFPQFNPQILAQAAKVNQRRAWGLGFKLAAGLGVGMLGLSGLVWLVNLPYPMIRRPVASTAPLLLLPSYLSMDRNYREAIAHVEQADQLVNKATSAADISLGADKVKLAQENLDQLPVWFLGYEPVKICSFMGCSWNFTFDEFSRARAQVGRMEARIFQETNALSQLQTAESAIQAAQSTYQSSDNPEQQRQAINHWQTGLDQLSLIPRQTLAGEQAEGKFRNYSQALQQIAGQTSGAQKTQTLVAAAQQFATLAQQEMANGPHSALEWQTIQTMLQQAMERLQQVKPQDPFYLEAQTLLAQYTQRLGQVQNQLQQEQSASQALDNAQREIQALIASGPAAETPQQRNQFKSRLTGILTELEKVNSGTTAYPQAQELIKQAQSTLKKL